MNAIAGANGLGVGLTSPLGGANKVVERLLGLGPKTSKSKKKTDLFDI